MKNLKIACLIGLFFVLLWNSSSAQVDDTLPPWFNKPGRILTPKIIDWNSTFIMKDGPKAISAAKSVNVKGKQIKLPTKVKLLAGPIVLKRGNNCYQIGCAQNKECGKCQMLWNDLNNDRKVQPRKELRCICQKSGKNCGLRGRKVECK